MTHVKSIDELIDELFNDLFGKEINPLYGKFVDRDGVYELKNGSFIKIVHTSEPPVRGKMAEFMNDK